MRRFPETKLKEFAVFGKLDTPSKIQDFIDIIPVNFEQEGDTCRSPLITLRHGKAHCMEGALLAAAVFWYHGEKPILLDLKATHEDESHVVTLFRYGKLWGAISKTNHSVLRYRDPVYRTPRELAMSYFNEYFLDDGRKTLRSFSGPFDLLKYNDSWLTSDSNLWHIVNDIDKCKHFDILRKREEKFLRPADPVEIRAGKLVQWKKKKRA